MKSILNRIFGLLLSLLIVFSGFVFSVKSVHATEKFIITAYPNIIGKSCVFQFSVPLSEDLKGGDWFKIVFPEGYELPDPGRQYREDSEPMTIEKLVLRSLSINLIQAETLIDLFYINYKENSMIFFMSKSSGIVFQKSHPLLISLGYASLSYQSFSHISLNQTNHIIPVKAGVYTFRFLTSHDSQEKISNSVTILPITGLINDLEVTPIPAEFGRFASYQLTFKTGVNHEIKANQTWLSIGFPQGIQHFTRKVDSHGQSKPLESWMSRYIFVNGVQVIQIQSRTFVRILCPVNVGPNTSVTITFLREFGLQNPMNPGDYTISIAEWVEYDSDPIKSKPFSIQKGKPVIVNDQNYSFYICLGEGEEISSDQFLYILLPESADLTSNDKRALKMNNREPKDLVYHDHIVQITCNQYIRAGEILKIDLINIKWSPNSTDYSYAYKMEEKNTWIYSDSYIGNRYQEPKTTTVVVNNKANQLFLGKFSFPISKEKGIQTDDSIDIEFPLDMQMPQTISLDAIKMEDYNIKIQRIAVVNQTVKLYVVNYSNSARYGELIFYILPEANIRNPKRENCWIDFFVSTSKDATKITFTAFLDPEPADSSINVQDNVKGQKEWLISAPLLTVNLSIPTRFIQINNHTYFPPLESIQLPLGQYSIDLTFFTNEEVQTYKANHLSFKVDTIKPLLKLSTPIQETVFSKQDTFQIQGSIETTPTHWNIGYSDFSQKTIDQELKINHKTVFFDLESGAFQYNLALQKGLNPVIIEVEDWAGNRIEKSITIAYQFGVLLQIGSKKMITGEKELLMDVAPILISGRSFVPIRFVGDVWGVKFQTKTNSKKEIIVVKLEWETHVVEINLETKSATKNGKPVQLDAPPFIQQGRLMVPLRFLSEQMGKQVTWDSTEQTILIL